MSDRAKHIKHLAKCTSLWANKQHRVEVQRGKVWQALHHHCKGRDGGDGGGGGDKEVQQVVVALERGLVGSGGVGKRFSRWWCWRKVQQVVMVVVRGGSLVEVG